MKGVMPRHGRQEVAFACLMSVLLLLPNGSSAFAPRSTTILRSPLHNIYPAQLSSIWVEGHPIPDRIAPSYVRGGRYGTFLKGEEKDEEKEPREMQNVVQQLKAFREMALPYYEESNAGRWLFAGMVGMTLLNSGVSVAFSYIGKDFWSALGSKDADQFYAMLVKFGGALVVGAPVSVLYRFQREQLAVHWREWMTDRTLQLYASNRAYYALERGQEIDNPDQRIAEDVRTFTAYSLQLFITVVTSIIDLVSFSFILYSIQPQLFLAIVTYAAFGTIVTTNLGRKLVGLNFEKLQKEADFRYSLVRVRDNAESIAFYSGEDIEGKLVSDRLSQVIDNRRDVNVAQRNLEFFTNAYQYLVQVVPVSVVAPQYFAGKIELGIVSQSAGAFNHILNDLSVIVNQFEQLATFSAGIDRLSTFMAAIREADFERSSDSPLMQLPNSKLKEMDSELNESDIVPMALDSDLTSIDLVRMSPKDPVGSGQQQPIDSSILNIKEMTLFTPDRKRTLITKLNVTLQESENLLIVGNSGAGKSSLLRAIAGLWTAGEGIIERPADVDIYFLPQRPYCALGSLKDQLMYPSLEQINPDDYPDGHRLSRSHILRQSFSDEDLLAVLDAVDLSELAKRAGDGDPIRGLSAVLDWSNTLSLGEQQRLAFGRVLVNRPRLVILDEATSALDMVAEAKMYQLLQSMGPKAMSKGGVVSSPGLTYISVGHRPSLLVYHEKRLRLGGEDIHEISNIEESSLDTVTNFVSNL
jgi:ABC-type uncharacterized transport system fused permease/ATPase subunit